jgi:NHL repeat
VKERHKAVRNKRISRLLAGILFPLIALGTACPGEAQTGTTPGIITTYAGSGVVYNCGGAFNYQVPPNCAQIGAYGFKGDGGPATSALLNNPSGIALDAAGDLFIADTDNNRIRKVTPNGVITTVAGTGQGGSVADGVPATSAQLTGPEAIAVDTMGNLLIADSGYPTRIRKVTPAGVISTIAGGNHQPGFSGDGGPATQAQLSNSVRGLAVDAAGDIFIADTQNNRIREVTPDGLIKTIAGNGNPGTGIPGGGGPAGDGGPATSASLYLPSGVAIDPSGNLYIADTGNNRIRKVTPDGMISSVGIGIGEPAGVTTDALGNVFVSAGLIWEIRQAGGTFLVAGNSTPPAGNVGYYGGPAGDGGPPTSARFAGAMGLAVDATGDLFIAAKVDSRILKVTGVEGSLDAGTFEPQLVTHLPAGFYIVEATLVQGSSVGFWGLEVFTEQSDGGFDLGGGFSQTVPGFGAFYLVTPQTVTATATTPLFRVSDVTLSLLDSNHQPIATNAGSDVTGTASLRVTLQPGFYIAQVTATDRAVFNYTLALSADFFSGGLDTGGYIGPGTVGFGAFYLPVDQDVSIRMFGRNTYGPIGAGKLVLTLRDANRNVIQQVGP